MVGENIEPMGVRWTAAELAGMRALADTVAVEVPAVDRRERLTQTEKREFEAALVSFKSRMGQVVLHEGHRIEFRRAPDAWGGIDQY